MIIDVNNLDKIYTKNFRKIHALRDVSFRVENNKILGILGPNGAGKTTLLKLITGIIKPEKNAGYIKILDTCRISKIKHRIGFLPENPEFLKNISAFEILKFSLNISGLPSNRQQILDTLEKVKLLDEKNEKVKNFSKGMRQRIGIAQAIIHSPELLILDEPMSGLDPPGRRMVIDIIENYFKEGKTVLFSTHNLDDIEALCTDVIVLNKGEIKLEKSISTLRERSSFKIEVEENNRKQTYHVTNDTAMWEKLREIQGKKQTIIKIQSGIAGQLEKYYD